MAWMGYALRGTVQSNICLWFQFNNENNKSDLKKELNCDLFDLGVHYFGSL